MFCSFEIRAPIKYLRPLKAWRKLSPNCFEKFLQGSMSPAPNRPDTSKRRIPRRMERRGNWKTKPIEFGTLYPVNTPVGMLL